MAADRSTTYRIDRAVQKTVAGLSAPLQAAKASEHLVCAELILQGWNAFTADAGLPYDVVVDVGGGRFCRVQVKATCVMMQARKSSRGRNIPPVYRFALRKSRCGQRRITLDACDHLALVALDTRFVAFIPAASVLMSDGRAASAVEFKSRRVEYTRPGKSGVDPRTAGRWLEDFGTFSPSRAVEVPSDALLDRETDGPGCPGAT